MEKTSCGEWLVKVKNVVEIKKPSRSAVDEYNFFLVYYEFYDSYFENVDAQSHDITVKRHEPLLTNSNGILFHNWHTILYNIYPRDSWSMKPKIRGKNFSSIYIITSFFIKPYKETKSIPQNNDIMLGCNDI